jgi:AAA15 family ATPase/GTPase
MAEEFANKIKRLELENFTCFGKVAMDFSPGINVFIGENGTGKTHLLKVLYGLSSGADIKSTILERVFKVFSDSELVKKGKYKSHFVLTYKNELITNEIFEKPITGALVAEPMAMYMNNNRLFVPTLELLSWFKGFISSYENRESYIDETYYYLAKAIDPLPLKGSVLEQQKPLMVELEEAINAKVIRRGNDFFVAFFDETKEYPVQVVATGINKLAQLIYLIMNGSLTKDTILFWDEPEANLNPKYILVVSKFLQTLAKAGCQIFVATHDYLLPYELSLFKEYQDAVEEKVPPMKFFTLMKGEDGTVVESGETMYDLPYDSIMEGHLQFHEKREQLQRSALKQ